MPYVLIVDDNPANLYMLEFLLKSNGMDVVTAENGREALIKASLNFPCLIISDILMPVMDGYTLCRLWKADENLKNIPFIFYTATYTETKDEAFALSIGADRFLLKPQEPEILMEIIHQVLDQNYQSKQILPKPLGEEMEIFKEYNEILFNKLEKKMIDLQVTILELKRTQEKVKSLNIDLEKKVQERTFQLEEINKELESFAYSVSHDLRAPLRAINGFSSIILQEHSSHMDKKGHGYLRNISENAKKMDHLITDLLTLSKTTIIEMKKSKVDMNKMLETILEEIKSTRGLANYKISLSPLGEILADPGLIQQVWINLIDNAIKYSKRKENPVIQIGCYENIENLTFFVKDNGAGFNPDYLDKLFNVFQRLHSSSDFEGTGVGLAIVKRIIRRHGGKVWAEGVEGEGATFYFSLPKDKE